MSLLNLKITRFSLPILLCISATYAQAAPDAGQLQQQIDREREIALPKQSAPVEVAPQPLKSLPSETVTVTAFSFNGNTLLTTEQLAPIVASYVSRPLSFTELQQAAAAVAKAYRDAGWIVRAYLPKQDITEGTVTIQIVEAIFGGTQLEGSPSRINSERLLNTVEHYQPKGQNLNMDQLDRAILLLDDLPGVTVAGSLQKGVGENETDLVLKTADEPLINGEISADNAGARSTGGNRINGSLNLNSPLKLGDQASLNVLHSRGTDYSRLAYSLPIGQQGLRIGVSGSYLDYDLVEGDFAGQGSGQSSTVGLDASYPLIRSRMKNLYVGINVDQNSFDNEFNQLTSNRYDITNVSLSLNGNLFDKLGGGGANAASLSLTQGDINLSNRDNRSQANANPLDIGGSFTKLNYRLSRQQVITDRISAFATLSGQAASDNLDSAEKFYLGGANGVRAYPANEGAGDHGQLLNLEIRGRLPYNFNITGFYDLGHIKINHDNPVGGGDNTATYKGVGLSLAWQADFGLNLKATWSHRIGDNPNPTATGNDQDGTLKKDRIWLNAAMAF